MIAVVDYGMGNLRSVRRALEVVGAEARVSRDPGELREAERLVLPGVGAFGLAMQRLHEYGLVEVLDELVMARRVPLLGICLGMQLVCRESHEHGHHRGLDWVPASVRRLEPPKGFRVPHIGWNDVVARPGSALLPDGASTGTFYFVHSYQVEPDDDGLVTATCEHGTTVAACLERDNILATQFHPEKSQEDGLALLRRFLAWQPAVAGVC